MVITQLRFSMKAQRNSKQQTLQSSVIMLKPQMLPRPIITAGYSLVTWYLLRQWDSCTWSITRMQTSQLKFNIQPNLKSRTIKCPCNLLKRMSQVRPALSVTRIQTLTLALTWDTIHPTKVTKVPDQEQPSSDLPLTNLATTATFPQFTTK